MPHFDVTKVPQRFRDIFALEAPPVLEQPESTARFAQDFARTAPAAIRESISAPAARANRRSLFAAVPELSTAFAAQSAPFTPRGRGAIATSFNRELLETAGMFGRSPNLRAAQAALPGLIDRAQTQALPGLLSTELSVADLLSIPVSAPSPTDLLQIQLGGFQLAQSILSGFQQSLLAARTLGLIKTSFPAPRITGTFA